MTTYITAQGDMWDSIAYSQMGDEKYIDTLMLANTKYKDVYIFSAGVELTIPNVEKSTTADTLPPWKQVT